MALISLESVSCRYPNDTSPALDGLTLTLHSGEILLVLGASDSGKSTLCRLGCGLFHHFYRGHTEGIVLLNGQDPARLGLEQCIQQAGMVFQRPGNQLSGTRLTVQEEVALGPENLGLDRAAIRKRVDRAMELVRITSLADRNSLSLSGGEQQRTALACVLAMEPELIILDEPTSQLDPEGEALVLEILRDLARQGHGILVSASRPGLLAEAAHSILVLDKGRATALGPAPEVLASEALPETGIPLPLPAGLALEALEQGLWPENTPLPQTMAEAEAAFLKVLHGH